MWAYREGMFPMARSRHGPVDWYAPAHRGILPLEKFHVPRSLRRRVCRGDYHVTFDQGFSQVIRACSEPRPDGADTWINDQIIDAYEALHKVRLAHSVEAWCELSSDVANAPIDNFPDQHGRRRLVGGLYGVALGGAFFGESMFTRATDASKVCLVHLVEHLRAQGFVLLDTQYVTPHLKQFGAIQLSRTAYLERMHKAVRMPILW